MREEYYEYGAKLSVENGIGIIRFLKNPESEDKGFEAICVFTPLSDKVVKISGMLGKMTRARLRLLFKVLLYKGWSVVYARRLGGRKLPMGKLMEDGDFAGWWRIDLKAEQIGEEKT